MALNLTIIKFPPGVSLGEDRKTVSAQGARIGRGQDNDWVLTDPERFLSSKHCQVVQEGERYYLVDLSTNGTFVNGSTEPLGRGKRVALNDGDSFDVGDYRFKVSMAREAVSFPDDPFKDSPSQLANKGSPFAPAKDVSNDIFMSSNYAGEVSDITPDEYKVTDPLQAIDNAQRGKHTIDDPLAEAGMSDKRRLAEDFGLSSPAAEPRGSQDDGQNRLTDAANWPEAKQEAGLLPEDWDADISLLHARAQPPGRSPASSPSPAKPQNEAPATGKYLPDDDSLIVKRPARGGNPGRSSVSEKGREKGRERATTPNSPKTPSAAARRERPSPSAEPATAESARPKAPTPAGPAPGGHVGGDGQALIDALGLDSSELSAAQISEINATVGVMMRETLEGLMQILRSRASIKNEFRINITTIQPVENNPIKFSANVDEILELMFVRRSRAYKGPVEAVQESFNTIADHQLAMIAGIRSAFRSALGKFDPIVLQEEFKQMGKSGVLPGIFKGSMWNAYQEYYQGVVNDMERSFHELFGDEFVQAYEEQLRKLAMARKRDL